MRIQKYKKRAQIAEDILWGIPLINFLKPKWAFYLSVSFNLEKINQEYIPDIIEPNIKEFISDALTTVIRFDKKFCYYLLAKTGVCIVALSWFNSTYDWFRWTLLEEDETKFRFIMETIRDFILEFRKDA